MTVTIITGPTASGKTAMAIELARRTNGEIINADSMQLYRHLPILTACPSSEEKQEAPHHLFEILGDSEISSAGWWATECLAKIDEILSRGNHPIVVGGTGMYLKSLTDGLSPIPDIPPAIRDQVRTQAQQDDFYDLVCSLDPQIRDLLKPNDKQRLTRAYEVKLTTGQSIVDWQKIQPTKPDYDFKKIALIPDKEWLHNRINLRFTMMIEGGALDEVKTLINTPIRQDSPILRAVGVKELTAYIKGEISHKQAIELGQTATRQYAKRQMTWIKGQATDYDFIPIP
ncbi:MAG: tRNA (adenosine(37)-N6)-dimethylallyltransferase MiaA [Candidatus Paracaedibacteraceae bacterium]|nr:tRNA (adenosine(37)-N6)-dimethylallyltransferase MiaA [Candidatus Paracaedibacteraceae bacterium]